MKTCLNCKRFSKCEDKKKSRNYVCNRWKKVKMKPGDNLLDMFSSFNKEGKADKKSSYHFADDYSGFVELKDEKDYEGIEINLVKMMDEVFNSETPYPRDLKIDDRDIPEFRNIYEYFFDPRYGLSNSLEPFARQLWIGMMLFGDYCYKCSDKKFISDIENCPIDMRAVDFPDKVQFLHNGICPKCKTHKLDFVRKGKMNFYRGLAACVGQRCITRDSLVLTEDGLVEIGDYAENKPYGFSPFFKRFNNGVDLESTSKFYRARPEHVYSITTSGGQNLKGTKDHPVKTDDGFLRLENTQVGNNVRIYYGQNCYGSTVVNLKDITDRTNIEFNEVVENCHHDTFKRTLVKPGYGKHTKKFMDEDIARLLGYWISEGCKGAVICNTDAKVLYDCYNTLIQMFSESCINLREREINFNSRYIHIWFRNLIGYDIKKGSAYKRIPKCILRAPKNIQIAFLQSLFEGDGSSYGRQIEYCTISKKLSRELQTMLLNIGIPCRVAKKMSWATNGSEKQVSKPVYILLIYGNALITFQKEIGFLSKRKRKRLKRVVKKHKSRKNISHHFYEKAPESYKKEALDVIQLAGKQLNQISYRDSKSPVVGLNTLYGNKGWDKLKRLRAPNVCLTKAKILYFMEPLADMSHLLSESLVHRINALLEFANSNYYYEKIVFKKYSKKKYETYDVTLPETHRFISNGMLSHNSGKSVSFSFFAGYHTHKMLKLQKPSELFTGLPNVTLTGTFTATDFKTAMETMWQPFSDIISESRWFSEYHSLLDYHSRKLGEEVYRSKESFLHYKHRKLFYSAASPNKRTLRGRCLTGSTLVNTSQGTVHLKELIHNYGHLPVDELAIATHDGIKKVSHTYKTEKVETYKVETLNGFEVEGPDEHRMLVFREDLSFDWLSLDKIKPGDWIVSKTKNEKTLYGENSLTKKEAALLGYFVANGYRNEISSNDEKVVKKLVELGKFFTGNVPTKTEGGIDRADSYRFVYKNGKNFTRDFLNRNGYDYKNSSDKQIPYLVRTASKEVMHEFLESYFECDCSINGGEEIASSEIEVSTASEKLAKQLHFILLKHYGILGRLKTATYFDKLNINTGNFDAKREHWIITITGYDASLFLENFKRAKVHKYSDRIKKLPKGYGSDRRNIPYVRQFLWDLYENARLTDENGKRLRRIRLENGSVVLNDIKPQCFDSLRSTRSVKDETPEFLIYDENWSVLLPRIKQIDSKKAVVLKHLLDTEAHFEKVVSVKKAVKKKTVYDVTVPDGEAFIANCLVSHNTRLIYGIDELGWFDASLSAADRVRISADEIYGALDRSLKTVSSSAKKLFLQGHSGITPAMSFNISSPSAYDDKIMELTRVHKESRVILSVHLPTWLYNPKEPKKNFKKEYMENPITAERDFGANPPMSGSPFFEKQETVIPTFSLGKNMLQYEYTHKKKPNKNTIYRSAKINVVARGDLHPSVLAIDAGQTNNSFALVIGHRNDPKEKRIHFSALCDIIPKPGKYELNYARIFRDVVIPICKQLNVAFVCADRWQSLFLLHSLEEEHGLKQENYSCKYADFNLFKSYLEGGAIQFCKLEMLPSKILSIPSTEYRDAFEYKPAAHLYSQIFTVEDKRKTVDKGTNRTDDLFRACVLASHYLLDDEWYMENMKIGKKRNANMGIIAAADGLQGNSSITTATGKGVIAST